VHHVIAESSQKSAAVGAIIGGLIGLVLGPEVLWLEVQSEERAV